MTIYFLSETIKTRRKWQIIFQVLKDLSTVDTWLKYFLGMMGEIKTSWNTIEEVSIRILAKWSSSNRREVMQGMLAGASGRKREQQKEREFGPFFSQEISKSYLVIEPKITSGKMLIPVDFYVTCEYCDIQNN